MNMIRTFSVPVNSKAAKVLEGWTEEGENISEMVRFAIERADRSEADARRIYGLSWALSMRGICPVSLVPEVPTEWVSPHSCYDCRKYNCQPQELEKLGVSPHFAQSVVGSLIHEWLEFSRHGQWGLTE